MNLSEYMSGRCLSKYNSMGVGVKKLSSPPSFFPGRALMDFFFKNRVDFHFSQ